MRKFLYRTFLLTLLTAGCLLLMLQSKSVKDHFAQILTQKLQEKTGFTLLVKDCGIAYPLALHIGQLECQTPHIVIDNLFCRMPLSSLLFKGWAIDTLIIDEVALDKRMISSGESPLPPSFGIANLQIKRLLIDDTPVSLEGGIKWDKEEGVFSGVLNLNSLPCHFRFSKERLFAICSQGSVEADFRFDEQQLVVKRLNVESDAFSVQGEGCFDTQSLQLSSTLNIVAFEQEIKGVLSGSLTSPHLQANLKEMELTASAHWDEGILLASVNLASPQFETIHFDTQLFSSHLLWPYTLEYHANKLNLRSEGAWKFDWGSFALYVDSLSGNYTHFPFALTEAAMIRNRDCSPLSFTFGGGTLYTTIDYIADSVHTTTRARNLPSEIFELWLPPLPFTSTVAIEAFLYGSPKSLNGHIQLDLDRMKILDETYVKLPPLQAHCQATLKEEKLECVGTIIGAGPYPMTLSATLPFKCQVLPPKVTIDQKSPIQAELTASGEISPYLQLFYSDTTNITGQAAIALAMEGTLENPQMSGELSLENGTFESYTLGTLFENISAKIIGRGSQVHLSKFSAETNKTRTVNATGTLALDPAGFYPFSILVNTNHAPIFQLDEARIITSGPLQLQGNLKSALISGDLTIERADFEIPKQISSSIKDLDVTYINQPEEEEPPTTFTLAREIFPIALDIRVRAQKGIHLTGKDLASEWRGEAFIKGSPLAPQLFGKVEAIKGEQLLNGKMFYLNQGSITFAGNYTDKASLYAIAEHEIGDISAEIVLKGPVNNPRIAFRSNPPLSQPEILSLILFNKPLPEISSLQGAELNQTFSALNTNVDDDVDLMAKLRKSLRIDRLEFNHSDNNGQTDISVMVGKYVTPGILVLVNKSVTTDAKSVAISANLIKSFKLQAEIDEEANSHLLLKWKRDY